MNTLFKNAWANLVLLRCIQRPNIDVKKCAKVDLFYIGASFL